VRRQQVRAEMCAEVRAPELMPQARQPKSQAGDASRVAGLRLLDVYTGLAQRGEHLLSGPLRGYAPKQWAHYPDDDAIDVNRGYQWFYHSHAPEDRLGTEEHGHIHLFARRKLWSRRLRSRRERAFAELAAGAEPPVNTRHLLTIGFDAKGIPIRLFTVNSWVTGDLMLSAETTAELLNQMVLDTGNEAVDAVIESVVCLFRTEILDLLVRRDAVLFGFQGGNVLSDASLEVLSELAIDIDSKLA